MVRLTLLELQLRHIQRILSVVATPVAVTNPMDEYCNGIVLPEKD